MGTAAVYENAYYAITENAELKMSLKQAEMVISVIETAHAENPLPVKF